MQWYKKYDFKKAQFDKKIIILKFQYILDILWLEIVKKKLLWCYYNI